MRTNVQSSQNSTMLSQDAVMVVTKATVSLLLYPDHILLSLKIGSGERRMWCESQSCYDLQYHGEYM